MVVVVVVGLQVKVDGVREPELQLNDAVDGT